VDNLKLIQVGMTICDEFGNYPEDVSTWQFNLKFDINYEKFSQESIDLLTHSGIDFQQLATHGIDIQHFGEYLITSGLLLNDELNWISFHGIYDFAYLLKVLTGLPLPENETVFFDSLKMYFPHYYDIRYLVRYYENFKGSLSRLGQELKLHRTGIQHQAGSDSILTSEIFFKLKGEYFTDEFLMNDKNVLFSMCYDEGIDRNYMSGVIQNNYNYQNQFNFTQFNNQNYPSYFPSEYGQVYHTQNLFSGPVHYNYVQKVNQPYIPGLKHPLNSYTQFAYPNNMTYVNGTNMMKNGKISDNITKSESSDK
jgi:CCR4-NOT transcription complex subunit 7/8